MSKLNITPGEWRADYGRIVSSENGYIIADASFDEAKLFADAGTTYNKCQMMPSELLEDRDKWINAFKEYTETDVDFMKKSIVLREVHDGLLQQRDELLKALNYLVDNALHEQTVAYEVATEAIQKIENPNP